jgi:hypothetical protein
MLRELDNFYLEQPEPNRSFMLGLRNYFLNYNSEISEEWKYKIPFFYYKNKPFCYIWKDNRTQQPYVGIVKSKLIEHPLLVQGDRKKMKVLYFDTSKDIPVELIDKIFKLAIKQY